MFLLGLVLGFIICWLLNLIEDQDDDDARILQSAIIASVEGYLRNKPLLTQQERELLQKVSQLHDLD